MKILKFFSFFCLICTWIECADYSSVLSVADSRYSLLKEALLKNNNNTSLCIPHFEKYFSAEAEVIRQFPDNSESSKQRLKKTIQYLIQSTDIFYSKYKEKNDDRYFLISAKLAEFLCRLKSNLVDEKKYRGIVNEFKFRKTSADKQTVFDSIYNCFVTSPNYSEDSLKYLKQLLEFRKKNMNFMNSEYEKKVREVCEKIKSDFENQFQQIDKALKTYNPFSCSGLDYLYKSAIEIRTVLKEFNTDENFEEIKNGVVKLLLDLFNNSDKQAFDFINELSGNPISPELTDCNRVYDKTIYFTNCYVSINDCREVFTVIFDNIPQNKLDMLKNRITTVTSWRKIINQLNENNVVQAYLSLLELKKTEAFQSLEIEGAYSSLSSFLGEAFYKETCVKINAFIKKDEYKKALGYLAEIGKLAFPWIQIEVPKFKAKINEAGYQFYFSKAKETKDFILLASILNEARKFKDNPEIKTYFNEQVKDSDFEKIQTYSELANVTGLLVDDFNGWDSPQGQILLYKPPINSNGLVGKIVFFKVFIKRKMDDYFVIGSQADLGLMSISDAVLEKNMLNFGDMVNVLAVYSGNAVTQTILGANRTVPKFKSLSVVKVS